MAAAGSPKPTGPLSQQYVMNVYLPSAVLILGAALIKKELIGLAVAIAASLAGWQIYGNRKTKRNSELLNNTVV